MKTTLQILFLLTLSTIGFSQVKDDIIYRMPSDQNMDWLEKAGKAEKHLQIELIKERLLVKRTSLNNIDGFDVPILIIDGIVIDDEINPKKKEFLETHLKTEVIDIKVIDKEPDGLYINKRFTGIVLIVFKDRRTSKNFRRLNKPRTPNNM